MALRRRPRAVAEPIDVGDAGTGTIDTSSGVPEQRHRGLSWRGQERLAGYILVAPALLMFATFLLGPLVYGAYLSLTDRNLLSDTSFIWFENYANLPSDPLFFKSPCSSPGCCSSR